MLFFGGGVICIPIFSAAPQKCPSLVIPKNYVFLKTITTKTYQGRCRPLVSGLYGKLQLGVSVRWLREESCPPGRERERERWRDVGIVHRHAVCLTSLSELETFNFAPTTSTFIRPTSHTEDSSNSVSSSSKNQPCSDFFTHPCSDFPTLTADRG